MYLYFIVFIPIIICEDKLIHVHSFWRHGERNPWILYFGDLNNASAFPDGLGQLTKNGVHQLYLLGQNYRNRYVKDLQLLSPNYVNSEVFARSTDFDRTKVSAMAFFSGLYSDGTTEDHHILVPIPINTIPLEDDFLNILTLKCDRKNELWDMVDNSQTINLLLNRSNKTLAETSEKTSVPLDFYKVYDIYDAAIVEESFGLPVPSWLQLHFPEWKILLSEYVSALWGLTSFPEHSFNLQKEITKISGGSTIAEIIDRWKFKIRCQNSDKKECEIIKEQKLYAYSGHDLTEIGLFAGLGFSNYLNVQTWPEHGSSVVMELWESEKIENTTNGIHDENYYFKIYYFQNYSVVNPKYTGDLIPECQGRKGCPLQYLFKRAELIRPKPDLKSYCNDVAISVSSKLNYSIIVLFMFFACVF